MCGGGQPFPALTDADSQRITRAVAAAVPPPPPKHANALIRRVISECLVDQARRPTMQQVLQMLQE